MFNPAHGVSMHLHATTATSCTNDWSYPCGAVTGPLPVAFPKKPHDLLSSAGGLGRCRGSRLWWLWWFSGHGPEPRRCTRCTWDFHIRFQGPNGSTSFAWRLFLSKPFYGGGSSRGSQGESATGATDLYVMQGCPRDDCIFSVVLFVFFSGGNPRASRP